MQMRRKVNLLLLSTHLSGIILVAGMSGVSVELRGPKFVEHRHNAVLRCEHNVDTNSLYKVVFFKNSQPILKYFRGREPPYVFYNVTGAIINPSRLHPTSITLKSLDFTASGTYACEIALETPLYSQISKMHELTVIVRQNKRPKIKVNLKDKYLPSDFLQATCQSTPAYPAPHLTWFINNVKVDERLTIPFGTKSVHRHNHGMTLFHTNSSLNYPLSNLPVHHKQIVVVTCQSTIPSYASGEEGFADIQNQTVNVTVWFNSYEPAAPTELSDKIVSSELNSSPRFEIKRILFALVVFVCHITN